jgi:hypothetical protein
MFLAPCKVHLNLLRQNWCELAPTDGVCFLGCLHKIDYIAYIENKAIEHNLPQFKLKPVSISSVKSAFRIIKSLSKGDDNIFLSLLKPIITYILPALTHINYFCILNSVVPDKWKHALVIPLPKVKKPSDYDDLRPIYILTPLSKILEYLVILKLKLDLFL